MTIPVKKKLDDVCLLISDCPHSTAPDEGEGYPLIRTPNIGKGRFLLDGVHRVSERVYKARNCRATPKDDDIIFAREAPAGNAAIIKNGEKYCLGQRTVLIRPNPEMVYPDYLVYYLLAPEQQHKLLSTAHGATVSHVNIPDIHNMNVDNLPDLPTQHRIASILSAYDDLIENNRCQIKLLEEAAQRLYREWFVELRFPGCEDVKIVDGVPEGWQVVFLGDVIEFDPKVPLPKDRTKQSVPMAALSTSSMVIDQSLIENTMSNSGSKFRNGDTLLARITPCLENGKTAFVDFLDKDESAVGSTEFIVMRSKILNPYMVYCIARSDSFRTEAINSMTGSDGRQRAQKDKLKVLSYLLPKKSLIDRFEQFMRPCFEKIRTLNRQISILVEARDKLLPKLMSGEVEQM